MQHVTIAHLQWPQCSFHLTVPVVATTLWEQQLGQGLEVDLVGGKLAAEPCTC